MKEVIRGGGSYHSKDVLLPLLAASLTFRFCCVSVCVFCGVVMGPFGMALGLILFLYFTKFA